MGTLSVADALLQKAQADMDLEMAIAAEQAAQLDADIDANEIANLKLALGSAVTALGLSLRYGMSVHNRRVARSAYRLGAAQLGMEHE